MAQQKTQQVSYDNINQEVIIREKRRKISGTFSAIGRLSTVNNHQDPDVFDRLEKVSKGAYGLFVELKRHRDEDTNLVPYPTSELPKTSRETFSRQLRELRDIGLVRIARRVMKGEDARTPYHTAKQTYMIDPAALKCWRWKDASILWEACKK